MPPLDFLTISSERERLELGALLQVVEVHHIGVVVLAVVILEGFLRVLGCQRVEGVRQGWEHMFYSFFSWVGCGESMILKGIVALTSDAFPSRSRDADGQVDREPSASAGNDGIAPGAKLPSR